jgi:hypothetical protein
LEKTDNMTKLELDTIESQKTNLKNLPNTVLISFLENLNNGFESTKQDIINKTLHLDKIEELYNIVLKEYQVRVNE